MRKEYSLYPRYGMTCGMRSGGMVLRWYPDGCIDTFHCETERKTIMSTTFNEHDEAYTSVNRLKCVCIVGDLFDV